MMLSEEEIRGLEKEAYCHWFDIYKEYCAFRDINVMGNSLLVLCNTETKK